MKNMVVDCAYTCKEYPNNIVVKVDGDFYLIPSMNRATNDLNDFKKLSIEFIKNKILEELPSYRYPAKELEKRNGVKITLGRPIGKKEFYELKNELNLSDDDVSEAYETVRGAVYGKESEKHFKCIQIKVEESCGVQIERKLKSKGIQADNINAGIIEIRVPE